MGLVRGIDGHVVVPVALVDVVIQAGSRRVDPGDEAVLKRDSVVLGTHEHGSVLSIDGDPVTMLVSYAPEV